MSGVLLFFFGVLQRELPIPLFVPPFPVRPVSSPLSQFSVLVPVVCVRFLRPGFFVVRSPSVSFLVAFPFPAWPQSPAASPRTRPTLTLGFCVAVAVRCSLLLFSRGAELGRSPLFRLTLVSQTSLLYDTAFFLPPK